MDGNGFPSAPLRGPGRPVPIIPLTALRPTTVSSVSLTTPRPETERQDNEYVETPLRGPLTPLSPQRPPPPAPPQVLPINKQPVSFSKAAPASSCGGSTSRPSVMCTSCGRCKCATCRAPKPLPEYWLCNGSCLVSADSIVDYGSCLCCVKGLFYHCSEADDEDSRCADDPCGCDPDRRAARWGCLAALVCALPCLVLYWPLRGAKRAVELCYERHSRSGCRCRPPPKQSPNRPPTKRLLGND